MTGHDIIDETAATAVGLLRAIFPSVRAIAGTTLLKDAQRTLVLRCALDRGDADAPATIIVKRMMESETCGFSDWGSLEFLGMTTERSGLAPRLYAGERSKRIYIIEDLGGSESLDDVLRRDDRAAAIAALMRMAELCARLNHATAGADREEEFERIRGGLPGAEGLGRNRQGERWKEALGRVRGWFPLAGARLDDRFEAECARLNAGYTEPGPFLSFTHGDIAPSNNHLRDGELRLIDFEYGGYRHALYDMATWNVLCPLPSSLLDQMLERYGACWSDRDGEELQKEWLMICIWRGLAMLGWFAPGIMEENRPWVEQWSSRDALLRTVRMIASSAARLGTLPGIAGSFARLADALAARWDDAKGSIPKWRALEGLGE